MKSQIVWNISVAPDIPERMNVAKQVLCKGSYGKTIDYFLTAFEEQFAEKIEGWKRARKEVEEKLALDPSKEKTALF